MKDKLSKKNIDRRIYQTILMTHQPLEKVKRHCEKVADIAVFIGEYLNKTGKFCFDTDQIYGAAILHDVLRQEPEHEVKGAELLEDYGFHEVGDLIRDHMTLPHWDEYAFSEKELVYLIDKMVEEDTIISIENRYMNALKRNHITDIALVEKVMASKDKALRVKERLVELSGIDVEILVSEITL